MGYSIVKLVIADTNPVVPADAGPMAPGKPFLNNGFDAVAVYPDSGSMNDAVIIKSQKWAKLPVDWVNVKIRTAGDTNVYMACAFTTVV